MRFQSKDGEFTQEHIVHCAIAKKGCQNILSAVSQKSALPQNSGTTTLSLFCFLDPGPIIFPYLVRSLIPSDAFIICSAFLGVLSWRVSHLVHCNWKERLQELIVHVKD